MRAHVLRAEEPTKAEFKRLLPETSNNYALPRVLSMTNKQTIDGVSLELRALLERVVKGEAGSAWAALDDDRLAATEELRALLDKPECCKISDADRALLDAGDYTPEELFGIGGKPSCPDCSKPTAQPQGEVERMRENHRKHAARLIDERGALRAQLAERDALLNRWLDVPRQSGRHLSELSEDTERCLSTSAEPKPRGEAVAFVDEDDEGIFVELIYGENGNPLRCGDKLYAEQSALASSQPQGEPVAWASPESLGGIRWRPQALDGLADGAPLYCWPNEQSAPLAVEAAKAFAKGFNTLESDGGKYRINMQFQSREDAWGAFNVLARLKQLNTPQ